MAMLDRIETNPRIMLGEPVIRGTRVTMEIILRKFGEGASEAEILDAYPQITPEDLRAALQSAAEGIGHRPST